MISGVPGGDSYWAIIGEPAVAALTALVAGR